MVTLIKRKKQQKEDSEEQEKLKQAKEKEKQEKRESKKQKKSKKAKNKQEKKQSETKKNRRSRLKREKQIAKERKIQALEGTTYAPSTGIIASASIMKSGNRYGTVFKVINNYGMNRNQKLGWAVNIIPEINVDGVKGYLLTSSKPFAQKEQSHYFKNVVPGTEETYEVNDTGNVNSHNDERLRKMRLDDLAQASVLDGDRNLAIDLRMYVLIVSDNPDSIQEQVRKLDKIYGKRISGIKLMSVAGEQEKMFRDCLLAIDGEEDRDYSLMSSIYSGFDHALRRGLNDRNGLPIGVLSDSHTRGQAFMNLDESFRRRILVASHSESSIRGYDSQRNSASSLWGQMVANHAMMNGHRTFHLVLNGHRYYGDLDNFACPPSLNKYLAFVNLSEGGLNPIQPFGDINGSVQDKVNTFNNLKEKLYQIMYLISGRKLVYEREDIFERLNLFYENNKMWDNNPYDNPGRIKMGGIKDPSAVKTFGDFVRILNTAKHNAKYDETATDKEKDSARHIHQTVVNALESYDHLFNRTTTLPTRIDDSKLQWFYDVSEITTPDIREAQFLNAFDYCTHQAKRNDIVMIHGVDKISLETMQIIQSSIEMLSARGVRIAYIFDKIGSGETRQTIPKSDIFNTDGILYSDLEQQFDYTILGTMSKQELVQYENKVKQVLNEELESALMRDAPSQFQIRRPADLTSNIVNPAEFIV
ncbi:TPA: hypothetical protein OVG04_002668 [Staphylococcus aureus]|uniref:hypothetical protein n=1 Tax=Staphylococcus warneri TaxID=1292 RepID=UPI00214BA3BE|nr:hypothetical protein [Staphylococcus warneri]MCR1798131.1 hypothetical protein [Staphylococcus warneri]HCU8763855.1 hypothetical protein [Staphylococcus aureus]